MHIINDLMEDNRFDPQLWALKGDIHYGLEEWKSAIHSYETAIRLGFENENEILEKIEKIKIFLN